MAEEQKQVYQFKITLLRIKPAIWRRIQVPEDYNFHDLSFAITNSMGWNGGHLHNFRMKNPATGNDEIIQSDSENDDFSFRMSDISRLDEKKTKIKDYFIDKKYKARFTYDFGDCWEHEVQFQRTLPATPGKQYPVCVAGKRACPPEGCGGSYGYQELLELLAKPKDQRTEEENFDLGLNSNENYDPEEFDRNEIDFSYRCLPYFGLC